MLGAASISVVYKQLRLGRVRLLQRAYEEGESLLLLKEWLAMAPAFTRWLTGGCAFCYFLSSTLAFHSLSA